MRASGRRLTATMETRDGVVQRPLPPVPRSGNAQKARQGAAQDFVARMRARAAAFAARECFDGEIRRRLADGRRQDPDRLVVDLAAPGGEAVGIDAWIAATTPRPAESAADRVPSPGAMRDDDGAARAS